MKKASAGISALCNMIFPGLYLQCRQDSVQLAVVPGLHIASVVLVEVGQAVVHEDVALQGRRECISKGF